MLLLKRNDSFLCRIFVHLRICNLILQFCNDSNQVAMNELFQFTGEFSPAPLGFVAMNDQRKSIDRIAAR